MGTRVAVVDDEAMLRDVVVEYLCGRGYEAFALDGAAELRAAMQSTPPDLVVLDVVMPCEDGLSVLRWIRGFSKVPVIMLTGETDTADRVTGLELGADDYLCKPADLRELLARVRSALRRRQPNAVLPAAPADPPPAWFGRWRLDRQSHRLVDAAGEVCPITPSDYALLRMFADHPGEVLSRDRLMKLSGNEQAEVFDLRISRLRRRIEPVPANPAVIRTIGGHGGGYEYVPSAGPDQGR